MNNTAKVACAVMAITAGAFAFYALNRPSNYNDCVLANIKDAQSDKAAIAVSSVCRSKFPEENYFDKYDTFTSSRQGR